jgi:hypothetical protein
VFTSTHPIVLPGLASIAATIYRTYLVTSDTEADAYWVVVALVCEFGPDLTDDIERTMGRLERWVRWADGELYDALVSGRGWLDRSTS